MPLNILSLDLDWFNFSEKNDLYDDVEYFFSRLKRECVLPRTIHIAQEHQYLYPWSVNLLDQHWRRPNTSGRLSAWNKITYRKMRVVNIDEHHDFYWLNKIDFDSMDSVVSCGNFFAYMAHQGLLSGYTWVIGGNAITKSYRDVRKELHRANSKPLKRFGKTIKIVRQSKAFSVLSKQKFDGFIIVKSPEYVCWHDMYAVVDEVLARKFKGYNFKRCQRRREFVRKETKKIGSKLFVPV